MRPRSVVGALGEIRTPDPQIRSLVLCSAEACAAAMLTVAVVRAVRAVGSFVFSQVVSDT